MASTNETSAAAGEASTDIGVANNVEGDADDASVQDMLNSKGKITITINATDPKGNKYSKGTTFTDATMCAAVARTITRTRIKHRLVATLSTASTNRSYTPALPLPPSTGKYPSKRQRRLVATVSEASTSSPDTADNISISDKGPPPEAARSLEFQDDGMDTSDDDATEATFGSCDAVDMNAESNNYYSKQYKKPLRTIHTTADDDANSKASVVHTQSDEETARGLCRALCLDGYRCPRLSKVGEPLCQIHLEQKMSAIPRRDEKDEVVAAAESQIPHTKVENADASSSGDNMDERGQDVIDIIVIDDDDDDDDDDGNEVPYTYEEFLDLWDKSEKSMGKTTDEIENSNQIRGANNGMSREDTDGQSKAQYGRLLPPALKTLMKDVMKLRRDDVFLDIGHGIGNTCLQAAFTFGCESRGIEVVRDRNKAAENFRNHMISAAEENPLPGRMKVGEVKLRYGRLEDESHRNFLMNGVTRIFLNNFNGNFADKAAKTNQPHVLDDYNAGLFGLMAPGTIMVTLHPLPLVPPTRDEANEKRVKQGLNKSQNASFYDYDKIRLGKACHCVKWKDYTTNQDAIYVYRYKRLGQSSEKAVFFCCNPTCEAARNDIPIPATTINKEGRAVANHCSCKVTTKSLRRQGRKWYGDDE